jgi:hypothetical protein
VGVGVSDLTPGCPDLAIATVLGADSGDPVRNRLSVDLSVLRTNRVVVDWADFDRAPFIGDLVTACDLIDMREATAEVLGVNELERTASIAIDWRTVREVSA